MSRPVQSNKHTTSVMQSSFGGLKRRLPKSDASEHQVASDSINLPISLKCLNKRIKTLDELSAIPESPPPSNLPISTGSQTTSKESIPTLGTLKTSDPASTSTAKALLPFWTQSTAEVSKKLWSCSETDCAASVLSSSKTSLPNMMSPSWFSVTKTELKKTSPLNLPKTFSPLQITLSPETTDSAQVPTNEDEKSAVTRKIELYPTQSQKHLLNQWIGTARWTYNQALGQTKLYRHLQIKTDVAPKKANRESPKKQKLILPSKSKVSFKAKSKAKKKPKAKQPDATKKGTSPQTFVDMAYLRRRFVHSSSLVGKLSWVKQTPFEIRDMAVRSVASAYKTAFASLAAGVITRFDISFKKKKAPRQYIDVRKLNYRGPGIIFPNYKVGTLKSSEPLPDSLEADSKIVKQKGRWYFCIPMTIPQPKNDVQRKWLAAIDPGVRTFGTVYDAEEGAIYEWGKGDAQRIVRIGLAMDKFQSRIYSDRSLNKKQRYSMKKAWHRMAAKIRNLTSELHKKMSLWLCQNYESILLPTFEVSQMVVKGKRKIGKKAVKGLLSWRHYGFKQHLRHKAQQYGVQLLECTEEYTSKTCGECGWLHHSIGGSKIFKCGRCNYVADRDFNGARSIALKHLGVL